MIADVDHALAEFGELDVLELEIVAGGEPVGAALEVPGLGHGIGSFGETKKARTPLGCPGLLVKPLGAAYFLVVRLPVVELSPSS
ncbi:hypothetical protein GCM10022211_14660 [Sphingomonas humi]|uniref:Uncharacterized protein n=1 Tax=Sphingomonas humi TaxID=335630 RepID=A0ABP7RYK1_9SPHN